MNYRTSGFNVRRGARHEKHTEETTANRKKGTDSGQLGAGCSGEKLRHAQNHPGRKENGNVPLSHVSGIICVPVYLPFLLPLVPAV